MKNQSPKTVRFGIKSNLARWKDVVQLHRLGEKLNFLKLVLRRLTS